MVWPVEAGIYLNRSQPVLLQLTPQGHNYLTLRKTFHFFFYSKLLIEDLNKFIDINRKFEKWDNILKSIMFAIIAELLITEKNKFKIVFDDYLNISKSLVSQKETNLINAIIQKYMFKDEINK